MWPCGPCRLIPGQERSIHHHQDIGVGRCFDLGGGGGQNFNIINTGLGAEVSLCVKVPNFKPWGGGGGGESPSLPPASYAYARVHYIFLKYIIYVNFMTFTSGLSGGMQSICYPTFQDASY